MSWRRKQSTSCPLCEEWTSEWVFGVWVVHSLNTSVLFGFCWANSLTVSVNDDISPSTLSFSRAVCRDSFTLSLSCRTTDTSYTTHSPHQWEFEDWSMVSWDGDWPLAAGQWALQTTAQTMDHIRLTFSGGVCWVLVEHAAVITRNGASRTAGTVRHERSNEEQTPRRIIVSVFSPAANRRAQVSVRLDDSRRFDMDNLDTRLTVLQRVVDEDELTPISSSNPNNSIAPGKWRHRDEEDHEHRDLLPQQHKRVNNRLRIATILVLCAAVLVFVSVHLQYSSGGSNTLEKCTFLL